MVTMIAMAAHVAIESELDRLTHAIEETWKIDNPLARGIEKCLTMQRKEAEELVTKLESFFEGLFFLKKR